MSKAVLLLNDMPEKCIECPLCRILDEDDYESVAMICKVIGYQEDFEKKPENCPLKPIPTKMSATANANLDLICNMSRKENVIYNVGYTQGRNTCIDEILEEEE